MRSGILRLLDAARDFAAGRMPVTYIENHDHESFMLNAGGRDEWWRTQPYAIALLTAYLYAFLRTGKLLLLVPGLPRSVDLPAKFTFVSATAISLTVASAAKACPEETPTKTAPSMRPVAVGACPKTPGEVRLHAATKAMKTLLIGNVLCGFAQCIHSRIRLNEA